MIIYPLVHVTENEEKGRGGEREKEREHKERKLLCM